MTIKKLASLWRGLTGEVAVVKWVPEHEDHFTPFVEFVEKYLSAMKAPDWCNGIEREVGRVLAEIKMR